MYLNPAAAIAAVNASMVTPPFPAQAIICWDQRYATKPLAYSECEPIVSGRIATGPQPSKPVYFSRHPVKGFVINHVPKSWQTPPGICKVGIDMLSSRIEQSSLLEIQAAARAILMNCVLGADHLGGTTLIGASGGLAVEILGV